MVLPSMCPTRPYSTQCSMATRRSVASASFAPQSRIVSICPPSLRFRFPNRRARPPLRPSVTSRFRLPLWPAPARLGDILPAWHLKRERDDFPPADPAVWAAYRNWTINPRRRKATFFFSLSITAGCIAYAPVSASRSTRTLLRLTRSLVRSSLASGRIWGRPCAKTYQFCANFLSD